MCNHRSYTVSVPVSGIVKINISVENREDVYAEAYDVVSDLIDNLKLPPEIIEFDIGVPRINHIIVERDEL